MLAEMVLPEVVDVGAGCQFLTRHLGLVVGVAVGVVVVREHAPAVTVRAPLAGRWFGDWFESIRDH